MTPSNTSAAANRAVTESGTKAIHITKIREALTRLGGKGTTLEIANEAGLEYAQCHKRISECPEIYDSGERSNISPSGYSCRVWANIQGQQTLFG